MVNLMEWRHIHVRDWLSCVRAALAEPTTALPV
jgi:hypothetical protein